MIIGLITFFLSKALFAEVPDPCKENILAVFRRPTVITSACTVPRGKFTFESGLDFFEYTNKSHGFIFPHTKVRMGLPGRNEFTLFFPNEMTNTKKASGLTASEFTFKHNIFYNEHWNSAVRAMYIPTSGSKIYGTANDGYTLNGVLAYRINSFNASVMLGYSSYSTPAANGGKRYNTFTPDVLIGWEAKKWLQFYAEVYGQTHSGPKQGPAYNMDTGLLFLITKDIEADIEVGHRLTGHLGNFNVYYGAGFGILF